MILKPDHPIPTPPMALINLIPFGRLDALTASIIAAHLQALIGLTADIRPARQLPPESLLHIRNQYNASILIENIAAESGGAPFKMGITDKDITIPILTYVYGESQLGGRAAIISVHRLYHDDPQRLYLRAAKTALHEAGHMLGLEHCWEIDCLMRFSKQLDQLDRLPMHFCTMCEYEIARRIAQLLE